MGTIRLLSDVLASQVAAGEVVERPASVLKELVENSIDAGAQRITVEFQRGGVDLLRITDDGSGMDHDDALMALERHATSKIRTASDLSAIETLGFRGEALPSIASVARFRLITRPRAKDNETALSVGTEVEVHGGKILEVRKSGENFGTRVEVKDLFYNVPARRKFLKSEQTESAHIIEQLQVLAVAHPEIAFTCLRDGREIFRLGATHDLAVRLQDLFGASFLKRMAEIPLIDVDGVIVSGFFAKPGEGRSDRSHQLLFINGRMVRSNVLSQPLREACDGVLAKGLHPQAVLFFKIDPTSVDCNVHPAKREVRFYQPAKMKAAALRAAAQVMGNFQQEMKQYIPPLAAVARSYDITRRTPDYQESLPVIADSVEEKSSQHHYYKKEELGDFIKPSVAVDEAAFEKKETVFPDHVSSKFRYIGRLDERYLILEEEDGLVLLEIRAALERVTYDALSQSLKQGSLMTQRLLLPEMIELSPSEGAWVVAHQEILKQTGFEIEEFGGNSVSTSRSFKVDTVPSALAEVPVTQLFNQLIDDLQKEKASEKKEAMMQESLARSVSYMASAAKKLPSGEEPALLLVRDLLRSPLPYATPLGRPTMIQLSMVELQRKFSR